MAVFASRQIQIAMPVWPIAVTITGSGDSTYCYATINGTKCYRPGTYEVNTGDTITFGVYGRDGYDGWVRLDGVEKLLVASSKKKIYAWTVPSDISTIKIAMTYNSKSSERFSRIAVTTA